MDLRYLNFSSKFEANLVDKIIGIKMKAKKLIEESEEFDPIFHEIKLVFRGKILQEDLQLGNYLKKSNVVQVFKKAKQIKQKVAQDNLE